MTTTEDRALYELKKAAYEPDHHLDLTASNTFLVALTGNTTLIFSTPHGSNLFKIITTNSGGFVYTAYPGTVNGGGQPDAGVNSVTVQTFTWDGTSYQGDIPVCTTCIAKIVLPDVTLGSGQASAAVIESDTATHTAKLSNNNGSFFPVTQTVCGPVTIALGTSPIASGAKDSTKTGTCTGAASTDVVRCSANADISAITGWAPSANGHLSIYPPFATSNTLNIIVENNTAGSITPSAVTLNCGVWR